LKEQSLVLLYRLMFVLYAESRNLIHPEEQEAIEEYEENFSLDQLRLASTTRSVKWINDSKANTANTPPQMVAGWRTCSS